MALTVENGTGLASAESYTSVSGADTYHTAYGNPAAWSGATTAVKETALRTATQYLDAVYGLRWKGLRANEGQGLDWPRANAEDYDGYVIASTSLPADLENANSILALAHVNGDTLVPDIADPSAIKRTRSKIAVLETEKEYFGGKSLYKKYTLVEKILKDLIYSNAELQRS